MAIYTCPSCGSINVENQPTEDGSYAGFCNTCSYSEEDEE